MLFELASLQEHTCLILKGYVYCSKSVGFRAFGDYWMSSSEDVHPFGNLAPVRIGVVCMKLLFQDAFCRNLCSRLLSLHVFVFFVSTDGNCSKQQ